MKTLRHDGSEFNVLYVHSELDDYGLTAHEFRLYAHLARRAGKDGAWPSVDSMAEKCRMNRDTVYRCLKRLKELNLVRSIERPGTTNVYVLTARSQWKDNDGGVSEKEGYPLKSDTPTHGKRGDTPYRKGGDTWVSEKRGYEGNPSEGNPMKENTAVGQEPSRDEGAKPLGASSETPPSPNGHFKPAPTPIQRKAFAIADRLEAFHWDNCKVSFSGPAAYSYVEGALGQGHEESSILAAYKKALEEAHQSTTDAMDRGERHRHEKASPALAIWLARRELGRDGKTSIERWKSTLSHMEAKRQEKAATDAKVMEEVLQAVPRIEEWFEKKRCKDQTPTAPSSTHPSEAHCP